MYHVKSLIIVYCRQIYVTTNIYVCKVYAGVISYGLSTSLHNRKLPFYVGGWRGIQSVR